ncbi:glycosyltransferase family 4 protein [Roseivirga pacifica]|uniref:glycosyltransferase family 4 protein n=1 Tax=Roseivirga pacifica TaxID=1267423 RepID=UPI003BAD3619
MSSVLITLFDLHFGGISNHVLNTVSNVDRDDVNVVYFGPNKTELPKFEELGISVTRIPYNGVANLFSTVRVLLKYLNSTECEVIVTNLRMDLLFVALARIFKKFRVIKVLHSSQNPYEDGRWSKAYWLNKFEDYLTNKFCNKVIAVSSASLKSFEKYRALSVKNRTVVYSGIGKPSSIKRLTDINISEKDYIKLLFVGRLVNEKGFDRVLNLLSRYELTYGKNAYRFELVVLGDGDDIDSLKASATKLANTVVNFKGYTKDILNYYLEADFLINGSRSEALGLTLIESISVGLPVIASNVGGIPEVIEDEKQGLLLDYNDSDLAVSRLHNFLSNCNDYAMLSSSALVKFERKFSVDHNAILFMKELIW